MCKIMMSIHPEFVDKILSGEKKYEFRKTIPRRDVDKIIIYSTSPIKKILAEVEVLGIVSKKPIIIWQLTSKYSGIEEAYFFKYFKDRPLAHAFVLGQVTVYNEPLSLIELGYSHAPQSFVYID